MSKYFTRNFRYVWNPKKPLMMMRVAWNYFLSLIGFMRLRYVDTSIGYRCNSNCKHCFNNREGDGINDKCYRMPPTFFSGVVNQCMRLGAVNFSLQGGEPLLYRDLEEYVKAAKPHLNLISISTNGKLLTPQKCKWLKKIGVDIVTISVDKFHKNHHFKEHIDIFETDEEIESYHQMIVNALAYGLKVTVSTVWTSESDKEPTSKHYEKLSEVIERYNLIWNIIYATGGNNMCTPYQIEYLKQTSKKWPYLRTDLDANWHKYGCGAAKEILYIKPTGDVLACPFIDVPFGNVRDKSIKKIRSKMLEEKIFSEYQDYCIAGEKGGVFKLITEI